MATLIWLMFIYFMGGQGAAGNTMVAPVVHEFSTAIECQQTADAVKRGGRGNYVEAICVGVKRTEAHL